MSDLRKAKDRTAASKRDVVAVHPEPPLNTNESVEEVKLTAWAIFGRALVVASIVFAAGFFLTCAASTFYNFKSLPHKGEIRNRSDATQVFVPDYPKMRTFAIVSDPSQQGSESQFTRLGVMGTTFFLYTILNTFHWAMEIGFDSLGGMVLIPLAAICIGSAIFFFKMIPRSMQKPDMALSVGIGISVLHASIILIFFVLMLLIATIFPGLSNSLATFASLYQRPYFYSGDVMMSTTRAGVLILILTGYTYGAISGGILYAWVSLRKAITNS